MHQLARQNSSGLDLRDHASLPFFDGTDKDDDDDSIYNKMYGEGIETNESGDDTPQPTMLNRYM